MSNNLDIWAIQDNPNQLKNALDNLSSNNDLLLYTNLTCNFSIGHVNVSSRLFDTALYSEHDNVLILLMLYGTVSADDLRSSLNERGFSYNEICFSYEAIHTESCFQLPEIWFARDIDVLDEAFFDSINNGASDLCYYFPFLSSKMNLCYYSGLYRMFSIDNLYFKGLIILDDKIILISDNEKSIDLRRLEVDNIVHKYGMRSIILGNSNFDIDKITKKEHQLMLNQNS